jgi:hypothetical protein
MLFILISTPGFCNIPNFCTNLNAIFSILSEILLATPWQKSISSLCYRPFTKGKKILFLFLDLNIYLLMTSLMPPFLAHTCINTSMVRHVGKLYWTSFQPKQTSAKPHFSYVHHPGLPGVLRRFETALLTPGPIHRISSRDGCYLAMGCLPLNITNRYFSLTEWVHQ